MRFHEESSRIILNHFRLDKRLKKNKQTGVFMYFCHMISTSLNSGQSDSKKLKAQVRNLFILTYLFKTRREGQQKAGMLRQTCQKASIRANRLAPMTRPHRLRPGPLGLIPPPHRDAINTGDCHPN